MISRLLPLRLPVILLLGALALAGGLALARLWLPEWQGTAVPDESRFIRRYRELARQAGITLQPGAPRVQLATGSGDGMPEDDRRMDRISRELQLRGAGRGARVRLAQEGTLAGDRKLRELTIDLSPSGHPRAVRWAPRGWSQVLPETAPASPERVQRLLGLLLAPGESAGELRTALITGAPGYLAAIRGSGPPEHLQAMVQGGSVYVSRRLGSLDEGLARLRKFRFTDVIWRVAPPALRVLAVLGLFV
ncbi:MAG: hypothetical protein ACLGI9_02300, partial [Thermoanaerobaculia bacterium]